MEAEKPRLPLTLYLPELVRLKEASVDFVLVAGQAVNFWARRYMDKNAELEAIKSTGAEHDAVGRFFENTLLPDLQRLSS